MTVNIAGLRKNIDKYVIAPQCEILHPERVEILGKFAVFSGLEYLAGGTGTASKRLKRAVIRYDGSGEAYIILDFGKNISGSMEIAFENSSGMKMNMTSGESKILLNSEGEVIVDENSETRWSQVRVEIDVPKGRSIWKHPNTFGAFRYLMLYFKDAGEVEISEICVRFSAYRGTTDKFKGWFLCDDEKLNEYYYKSAYTLNLCTVKSGEGYVRAANTRLCDGEWALVDGAKRDRLIWICDLNVSAASMYATFNETGIIKSALAEMVKGQLDKGNIPAATLTGFIKDISYSFFECAQWWIYVFEEYFRYTGDVEFVSSYYGSALKMISHAESLRDDKGLIRVDDANNRGCMWSVLRYGWSTINNLLLAYSYKAMEFIANELGKEADQKIFNEKWQNSRSIINKSLFDKAAGAYMDSESNQENHPLAENALAVMLGIAPEAGRKAILDFITDKMWSPNGTTNVDIEYKKTRYDFPAHNKKVWPWLVYYEIMARLQENDTGRAFEAVGRTWGAMDGTDANSAYWEGFNPDDVTPLKGANNLSHGISTGVIPFLSFGIMGIKPVSPGFKTFEFKPNPGSLKCIAGEVPTPSGAIKVNISVDKGIYEISIPEGLECSASLPATGAGHVIINGKPVDAVLSEQRFVLPRIKGGIYRIIVNN